MLNNKNITTEQRLLVPNKNGQGKNGSTENIKKQGEITGKLK